MPNQWFQFKQFRINQDRCAMKVGTDAVILGAWTETTGCRTALDIGTGTGLLALMLAQKNKILRIDAIEIDPVAVIQAKENFVNSPFSERIMVTNSAFQDLLQADYQKRYDLIICNPPYFSTSKKGISDLRNLARHDDLLSLDTLLEGIPKILSEKGKFSLISPANSMARLRELVSDKGLFINRILEVFPTPDKNIVRYCFEISNQQFGPLVEKLVIETGRRHEYSNEYRMLTDPFYL